MNGMNGLIKCTKSLVNSFEMRVKVWAFVHTQCMCWVEYVDFMENPERKYRLKKLHRLMCQHSLMCKRRRRVQGISLNASANVGKENLNKVYKKEIKLWNEYTPTDAHKHIGREREIRSMQVDSMWQVSFRKWNNSVNQFFFIVFIQW